MFAHAHHFYEQLEEFFSVLPDSFSYAVELRNPAWLDQQWFSFLAKQQVCPVLLEGYWMEPVSHLIARYGHLFTDSFVLRLHGDDRAFIEDASKEEWNQLVLPKDGELVKIAPQLIKLAQEGKTIYVNVNNHYEGSAPLTIRKLVDLLGIAEKKVYD